jgi:hypothetical protein
MSKAGDLPPWARWLSRRISDLVAGTLGQGVGYQSRAAQQQVVDTRATIGRFLHSLVYAS